MLSFPVEPVAAAADWDTIPDFPLAGPLAKFQQMQREALARSSGFADCRWLPLRRATSSLWQPPPFEPPFPATPRPAGTPSRPPSLRRHFRLSDSEILRFCFSQENPGPRGV